MKAQALAAEFIGTFALLFVIFNVVVNIGNNPAYSAMFPLALALGLGLTMASMGTAFGGISGAHFNPCVTLAMVLARKIGVLAGLVYWVVQVGAAIAAMLVVQYINKAEDWTNAFGSTGNPVNLNKGLVAEGIAAFFFLTVVFMTAVDKRAPKAGGAYLGFMLGLGVLSIFNVSGAAINPAVGVALSLASGSFENIVVWTVGPFIGAAVAALLYIGVFAEKEPAAV